MFSTKRMQAADFEVRSIFRSDSKELEGLFKAVDFLIPDGVKTISKIVF